MRIQGIFFLLALGGALNAQSEEHKWNIGIHGGAHQYMGELGNGWYSFNQAYYGLGGLSVSRYLSRHFDVSILGTRGEMGHVDKREGGPADDAATDHFLVRLTTVDAFLRYFPLGRTRFVQPYLFAGGGIMLQQGLSETPYTNGKPFDLAMPAAGAGLQFPLGGIVAVQLQETYIHSSTDMVDGLDGGLNDLYLMHSIGLTFNLARFWGNSGNGNENIDKCPKMPKEMEAKRSRDAAKMAKPRNGKKKSRK
jgi:OmpA-OmpF porin, OOP family